MSRGFSLPIPADGHILRENMITTKDAGIISWGMNFQTHPREDERSNSMKIILPDGSVQEAEDELRAIRHTASHVLAQAVKRLYPETKLAIGPAIDLSLIHI